MGWCDVILSIFFSRVFHDNIVLIANALQGKFIIPDWEEFCVDIEQIFASVADNMDGELPTYIPQLARAEPDRYAVSVCTVDGQR